MTTRRLLVSGLVQGVSYRWWTVRTATALGLTGWVRNLRDGRVEIMASGTPEALDRLVEVCHRGPDEARVDTVETSEVAPCDFAGFEQRPTA